MGRNQSEVKLRVPTDLKEKFTVYAASKRKTISSMLREYMKKELK